MKGLNSNVLILVALLAFVGQVLAMPFMSCCDEMRQFKPDEMDFMRSGMEQAVHSPDTSGQAHTNSASHDHGHMMGQNQEDECSFHCDFCGVVSVALQSGIFTSSPVTLSSQSFLSFITAPAISISLFRPPISA